MDTAIYVNLSSQVALRRHLDIIANNIANVSTTGYRAERAFFQDFIQRGGEAGPLAFVIDRATYTDTKQGSMQLTDRRLDFGIDGDGYFAVQLPDGEIQYTRDGRFNLNSQGQLVTAENLPVLSNNGGPITIPLTSSNPRTGVIEIVTSNLDVSSSGIISANGSPIGQIGVFQIQDTQALNREPNLLYSSDETLNPVQQPRILQGFLESSNVNAITEITRFLNVARTYQSIAGAESDIDNLKRQGINRLGGRRV